MKRSLSLGFGLAMLLAGAGCSGRAGGSSGSGTSADAPTTGAPPAADAAPADAAEAADLATLDEIPTTDQLEQKLAETVTDANADAEFEKLQKEVEADPGN